MYSTTPQSHWNPYTIPPTPNVVGKSYGGEFVDNDPYILSPKIGSVSSKNPSEFLEWSQLPINNIFNQIETIQTSIESLETSVEALQTSVESLKKSVETLQKSIETLQTKVQTIESNITTINNRLDSASIDANCLDGTVKVTLNL